MEQFFQRMQVRRETLRRQQMSKRDQWKTDESETRQGCCEFSVKYLGYTDIHQSKGADICRQSFNKLKYEELGNSFANVFQKHRRRLSSSSSHHYATLQISSEGLRIIDENDDILVDTPIKSISFCCPNSQHERGFTYICRGDAVWKWICHAMEATDDLGERLNHAVGCAFSICLEKKLISRMGQSLDHSDAAAAAAAAVPTADSDPFDAAADAATASAGNASHDFQKLSITERQLDPQASIVAGSLPQRSSETAFVYSAIDRPRAPAEYKERKGSLGTLMEVHPYKRRVTEKLAEEEIELNNNPDA